MRVVASVMVSLFMYFTVLYAGAQDVPGNPVNGRRIYEQSCARCHGVTGAGDGPDAGRMGVRPADLRSMGLLLKSDLELMRSIAYGVAFSPMHEWRDQMSNQEMWDVVRYLRTLVAPQGQSISARQDDQPRSAVRQEPTPSEKRILLITSYLSLRSWEEFWRTRPLTALGTAFAQATADNRLVRGTNANRISPRSDAGLPCRSRHAV